MTEPQTPAAIDPENLPDVIPILPLFDATLFPKMVLPLVVMEGASVRLVDEAMGAKRIVGLLVSKKAPGEKKPIKELIEGMASVGTAAIILKMAKTEDNKAQMLVQGLGRFKVQRFIDGKPYLQAQVARIEEIEYQDKEIEALKANLQNLFIRIVELSPGLPQEIGAMAKSIQEPGVLADMVASSINTTVEEKQQVLESIDIKERLRVVTRIATQQLEILELGNKIQSEVKGGMERSQREYYLRQQLKAIKEELGEKDESQTGECSEPE